MKYYGIKQKIRREKYKYKYAKVSTWIKQIIPGKNRSYYREYYNMIFGDNLFRDDFTNSIPQEHFLDLRQLVVSDLIHREDLEKLQKGIHWLLKKYRAGNRFLALPTDSLKDISEKIDQMDSTRLSWYESCRCGVFVFGGESLGERIDYFTVQVRNINSSYLSIEFRLFFTETEKQRLKEIINADYHDRCGYAAKTLYSPQNGGAVEAYTVVHYSNEGLKADKIYEHISCIEWEFFQKLSSFFPFVLHGMGEMPPRIEVYFTDIDYHDNNRFFWDSVGISDYNGQFIDENQKIFFAQNLSGRYSRIESRDRVMYIIKGNDFDQKRLKSVKHKVDLHMEEFACEYFKFLFLVRLARNAGKVIIKYKRYLDKVKLERNQLKRMLKLRYNFELEMDSYIKYARDDIWKESLDKLGYEIYQESDAILKNAHNPFVTTYKSFANWAMADRQLIDEKYNVLQTDFENKGRILQRLYDYKSAVNNKKINSAMLVFSGVTLLFVIFPKWATWMSEKLTYLYNLAVEILKNLL